MNPFKYTTISHKNLVYANPVSVAKMEQVYDLLNLSAQHSVLDIGTGKAEVLIRLVERYGVTATGVDRLPEFVELARTEANTRIAPGKLTMHQIEAYALSAPPESFDLTICIGATAAYGNLTQTLAELKNLTKLGGQILVGELYWKQTPSPDYLEAFGVRQNEYTDYAGNIGQGTAQGLTPLYTVTCSEDDFDAYEWTRIQAIETYARQHPDDPDVPELLKRIRWWRDLYLRWGRETLGFGLYLYLK